MAAANRQSSAEKGRAGNPPGSQEAIWIGHIGLYSHLQSYPSSTLSRIAAGVPLSPGVYVYLEVSDTGSGLTEDVRSRMFDPFFSTKYPGRGLGLSTVWGLVRSFQGGISVVSQPGQETTIRVLLPVAGSEERHEAPRPEAEAPVEPWRGSGTMLLVEDEEIVRRMSQAMLSRLGFRVLAAG